MLSFKFSPGPRLQSSKTFPSRFQCSPSFASESSVSPSFNFQHIQPNHTNSVRCNHHSIVSSLVSAVATRNSVTLFPLPYQYHLDISVTTSKKQFVSAHPIGLRVPVSSDLATRRVLRLHPACRTLQCHVNLRRRCRSCQDRVHLELRAPYPA